MNGRIGKTVSVTRAARIALAFALCLACACAPAAQTFAAPDYTPDYIYGTNTPIFDISTGPVTITNGSTPETLGVRHGPSPQTFQDLVLPDETIVITGVSTSHSIEVNTTRRVHILLDDVSINRSLGTDNACAFSLIPGADVVLNTVGKSSTLISGPSHAGIRVPRTASIEIVGDSEFYGGPEMDIILVIDVSGSMYGNRIDRTKVAAIQFCTTVLNEWGNARISLVTSANQATIEIEASSNINDLTAAINAISAYGGNADPFGLPTANALLSTTTGRGVVVLLSDGVPDSPQTVYNTAQQMMQYYDIYTIGVSPPSMGKQLLQNCQNKGYYDVENLSDLQDVFVNIADDLISVGGSLTVVSAIPAAGAVIGGAGIGGNDGEGAGGITVRNANLMAYSGGHGAGIGGGRGGDGGHFLFDGGVVEAYSALYPGLDGYGAGIGGGYQSPCGTVVITDHDRVRAESAIPGKSRGAAVGAGYENANHGNQLILTNSPGGDYLIGRVVLPAAVNHYVISALDRLIIPAGASLTVPANVTFVNDGVIENYGSLTNNAMFVNNGRFDNFASFQNNGQFIRNPGSFYEDPPIPSANDVSYFDREIAWSTPGGGSSRSFSAANGKAWVNCNLSGTAATLYLTPQKAEEIVRNSEDGTADFDLADTDLTEWSFPKAALAYFAEKGLAVEFKTSTGLVRLDRTAAADLADQGGGDQFHLLFRRTDAQALSLGSGARCGRTRPSTNWRPPSTAKSFVSSTVPSARPCPIPVSCPAARGAFPRTERARRCPPPTRMAPCVSRRTASRSSRSDAAVRPQRTQIRLGITYGKEVLARRD
jgi:hypothetical protein